MANRAKIIAAMQSALAMLQADTGDDRATDDEYARPAELMRMLPGPFADESQRRREMMKLRNSATETGLRTKFIESVHCVHIVDWMLLLRNGKETAEAIPTRKNGTF